MTEKELDEKRAEMAKLHIESETREAIAECILLGIAQRINQRSRDEEIHGPLLDDAMLYSRMMKHVEDLAEEANGFVNQAYEIEESLPHEATDDPRRKKHPIPLQ